MRIFNDKASWKWVHLPLHLSGIVLFILVLTWITNFSLNGSGFALQSSTILGKQQLFAWHPFFNVLAFGVLMNQSLVAFRIWDTDHRKRKIIHLVLHSLILILAILAFIAVLVFHQVIGASDFYSAHSWIGLMVFLMLIFQYALGFIFYFLNNVVTPDMKKNFMVYHKLGGIILYIGGVMAMASGIMQRQSFLRIPEPNYRAPIHVHANFLLLWIFVNAGVMLAIMFKPAVSDTKMEAPSLEAKVY